MSDCNSLVIENHAMFSIRNVVLVALMQTSVIVVGVLASGLWRKFSVINGLPMPEPAATLYNYGVWSFTIPIAWAISTLALNQRQEVSEAVINLTLWTGVVILLLMLLFVVYADISPFFRIMWRVGDDGEM